MIPESERWKGDFCRLCGGGSKAHVTIFSAHGTCLKCISNVWPVPARYVGVHGPEPDGREVSRIFDLDTCKGLVPSDEWQIASDDAERIVRGDYQALNP